MVAEETAGEVGRGEGGVRKLERRKRGERHDGGRRGERDEGGGDEGRQMKGGKKGKGEAFLGRI